MKVLKGSLTEVKYSWPEEQPDSALISNLEPKCVSVVNYSNENDEFEKELEEISRSTMNSNDVCYING